MALDCAGELGWDKLGKIKGKEGRLGRIGDGAGQSGLEREKTWETGQIIREVTRVEADKR